MERIPQLEALLLSVQRALGALGEVDGFDRWGRANATADQLARYAEQERENRLIYDRDVPALQHALATLTPEVRQRWVSLHVQLLEEAALAQPMLAGAARADLATWKAFGEGTRRLEDLFMSTAWVDPVRRRELLGVEPG